MKRRRIIRTAFMLATSLAALGGNTMAKESKESKNLRQGSGRAAAHKSDAIAGSEPPLHRKEPGVMKNPVSAAPLGSFARPLESSLTSALGNAPSTDWIVPSGGKYPWKTRIVTTTFWIGEDAAPNNPVPNVASSWDENWSKSYGGVDTPVRGARADFVPVNFVPQQNPFYIALPYNDITSKGHKPEAASVIPWFKESFQQEGHTVLKGRWIAIRYKDKVAYAQWEDCGPFRTDHSAYVFGTERPKPNLNRGAGLDVSPAVRDYLGMSDTDVTDWRFVDFDEVPRGPWAMYGENNTFVLKDRKQQNPVVLSQQIRSTAGEVRVE